jgi:hypothetical protein
MRMNDPRGIIERTIGAIDDTALRETIAGAVIATLRTAGYVIVPAEPTHAMIWAAAGPLLDGLHPGGNPAENLEAAIRAAIAAGAGNA